MFRLISLVLMLAGCGCPQEYRTTVASNSCYQSSCGSQPSYSGGPFSCSPRSGDYTRTEFRCWDRDFNIVFCDGRNTWSRPGCYYQGDSRGLGCTVTHVCSGW